MRVLLILDWNRGRGGAESYALCLREQLLAAGDEVRLLTSSAGTAGDGLADYVAFGTERRVAQALLQIVNPFAVGAVRRAIREFGPDVAWVNMFAHQLSPAVIGALGDLPTVLYVSDYKCVCPIGSKLLPDGSLCTRPCGWICYRAGCVSLPHWLRDRPRYALIRLAVRRTSRVLACSSWVQQELAAAGISAEVIPLPVAPPPPGFLRQPAREPLFIFCGRLDREKGVSLLVQAFARVRAQFPEARLRVIGQGPERADLESRAARLKLGDSIEFPGWLTPAQVERHWRDAWACVVPSLWAEPQGLVALEAVLRGVPVVASGGGGLGEIIEHGVHGLLFPNNNEDALVDALRAIASGEVFPAHNISENGVRKAAETYDVARHVRQVRAIFSTSLSEFRACSS
jgi:glycosyltransferase involved in cell wall biosynthesis